MHFCITASLLAIAVMCGAPVGIAGAHEGGPVMGTTGTAAETAVSALVSCDGPHVDAVRLNGRSRAGQGARLMKAVAVEAAVPPVLPGARTFAHPTAPTPCPHVISGPRASRGPPI